MNEFRRLAFEAVVESEKLDAAERALDEAQRWLAGVTNGYRHVVARFDKAVSPDRPTRVFCVGDKNVIVRHVPYGVPTVQVLDAET